MYIGIPTNEPLCFKVGDVLRRNHIYPERRPDRKMVIEDRGMVYAYARVGEIARLILEGPLDAGFVTRDLWEELTTQRHLGPIALTTFGECECDVALLARRSDMLPAHLARDPDERDAKAIILHLALSKVRRGMDAVVTIATRFPALTRRFLADNGMAELSFSDDFLGGVGIPLNVVIHKVQGSEELNVLLGVADLAVAQVETGETARVNNLEIIATLMNSQLMAVAKTDYARRFVANLR